MKSLSVKTWEKVELLEKVSWVSMDYIVGDGTWV